jgi:morphogenetic protein associated with SpoVID
VKIHIVQKGDTLWKIAQKYGVDFEQLKKMNGHLSNPDMIMPGMKIKVPTAGVPVKKEVPKKETKINMTPKKEAENIEHPYANIKPFVSVNIEAEFSPNEKYKEKEKVNESPKPPVNEAPNLPLKEAPKPSVDKVPKPSVKEAPKPSVDKVPKPSVKEAPKPSVDKVPKPSVKEMPKPSVNEVPNLPVNETPNLPVNEAPNLPMNESPNPSVNVPPKQLVNKPYEISNVAPVSEEKKELEKELKKQLNIPPLFHTIPPVMPNVNINFSNAISNVPPIPPKPENILPGIMKPELESPAEEVEEKELEADDTPPELPKVPYVPMMQQPYLTGGAPVAPMPHQPCVLATPILPGAGYYFPFMPTAPVNYPTYPQLPTYWGAESSSHAFPGIEESSSESGEVPPMPDYQMPEHNVENVASSKEKPTSTNIPPASYALFPSYTHTSYPVPYAPIPLAMQEYGWHPMFYPYMPLVSYGYYPSAAFASYPYPAQPYVAGPAYPFTQAPTASAFPRTEAQLFTEPQDEENNDHW